MTDEEQIRKLERFHIVRWFSPYHVRIDGRLDLYPTNRRYHVSSVTHNWFGARGNYEGVQEVVDKFITFPWLKEDTIHQLLRMRKATIDPGARKALHRRLKDAHRAQSIEQL